MSREFRCDALDTPQAYVWRKIVPHKIGPWKFRDRGQIALFGLSGTQKGPDTRSKYVVSMSPTQADQSGAVGTKFGPSGPPEDLRGPQKGISGRNRPFLPVFDLFLELGGSKWAITVLDE